MRRLTRLLLGLMVTLSLGLGAIAHAGEAVVDSASSACVEIATHERDGAPGDGDAEKWGLHAHGGCHGHHQVDAIGKGGVAGLPPARALSFAAGKDFLPQLVPDANLRPPIA
ncbi:conserved exported protein of unknown function [uncultured Sphingopyxis sp.]|uniref:Uncharacterized protein n=1 Tax=uncultured Sphingopyxis sp. TaxID=310581 RepID=A0A1Y5PR54_9SPHN|nr:hypothetical protein [uncultured Sphingopyxis sp.]SBV32440.1 conserved exported protein of unknown function [uncultured Sphingopyxis sp.]